MSIVNKMDSAAIPTFTGCKLFAESGAVSANFFGGSGSTVRQQRRRAKYQKILRREA